MQAVSSLDMTLRSTALPQLEDSELILRAAGGDEKAFETLYQRHRAGLYGFLLRRLRNPVEAEDAVAVTFFKAWRGCGGFRGQTSGKAWLFQIATRVALDCVRRDRRHPEQPSLDGIIGETPIYAPEQIVDPEAVLLSQERELGKRQALAAAISRLSERERHLLQLYYFDGHSCEEISRLLDIPYGRVRGRLNLIRGRIRRDLVLRQQWQPA